MGGVEFLLFPEVSAMIGESIVFGLGGSNLLLYTSVESPEILSPIVIKGWRRSQKSIIMWQKEVVRCHTKLIR